MDETDVVTAFLRNGGDVLLCRRPEAAPTFPERWSAVSGYVESGETVEEAALREIREEVGVTADVLEHVRSGGTLRVESERYDRTFVVHPVLFDCDSVDVEPSEELAAIEWTSPTELFRRDTVPRLWETYERVAPSVRSIAADGEHGAAYLSVRALEVLRDRAGILAAEAANEDDAREELESLATRLLEVRPSMAVLRNRVNRTMARGGTDPGDVERTAIELIDLAIEADDSAASQAATLVEGRGILTLSWSGTVRDALVAGDVQAVYVAESRPDCEGIDLAETLQKRVSVTVHTDAAVAHVLGTEPVDAVVVGADTILPDGQAVNKTGTRAAAIAAAHEMIPVYVVAASDKITTRDAVNLERGDAATVYDGDADLDVLNPIVDVTPASTIEGYVTERGVLDADEVGEIAAELAAYETW